jgi:hypothetical protein
MKNHIIFLVALFFSVICFQLVYAETFSADKLSDEWYYSGDTIAAKGKVFTTFFSGTKEYISVKDESGVYTKIDFNTCKRIGDLGFCFPEWEFDEEKDKNKFRVEVYDLETVINVSRTITENNLITGEETTIDVVLYNDADKDLFVEYIDEFPDSIEITDTEDVSAEGRVIKWSGVLKSKQDKEFSYDIRAVADTDAYLVARIISDGETYYTDVIYLVSKTVLKVDFKWSQEPLMVGYDEQNLTISLTNNEKEDIDVNNFTIYFPDSMDFIKGMYKYKSYSFDETVSPGETENITFRVIPRNYGFADVNTVAFFDFVEKKNLISKNVDTVEVGKPELYIRIKLDENGTHLDDDIIEARKTGQIKVDIQKSNPDVYYRNVNITINGSALNEPVNVFWKMIDNEDNNRAATINFTGPELSYDTTLDVNVYVDFETQFGDKRYEDEEYEFEARSLRDISIYYDIDPGSPESGEEFDLGVRLRNERLTPIKNLRVCTFSDIPSFDNVCKNLSMREDSESDVMAFKIKAPIINESRYYFINTTVDFSDSFGSYSDYEYQEINVQERKLEPGIDMFIDNSEIPLGAETYIDYRVRNDEKETLKNMELHFVPSQYFDIIGNTSFFIGNVDPDEEINFYKIEKVRAKKNESQQIEETVAYFNDFYFGRLFNYSSDSINFDVKDAFFNSPMIIANKSAPSNVNQSDYFPVVIVLKNIGNDDVKVIVTDNFRVYEKTVFPGKVAEINFSMKIDNVERQMLPSTLIEYSADGKKYTTTTNDVEVYVEKKPEIVEQKEPVTEKFKLNETEAGIKKEREPLIIQFINYIKSLFSKRG